MPDVVAKAMAVISGFLLVAVLAVLYVTSQPPAGTQQVVAQFQDAFPMLEGMQVRVDGAVAGSLGTTKVDSKGLADVTLLLKKSIPAPRTDATATIRQADTTGDSYIDYDPGSAKGALSKADGKPTITCDAPRPGSACTNTLAAPRFDDLLNAFGPPEQAGVKLLLQSLSDALAHRGADVNRAALRLVPALDAANEAVTEVGSQNTALKALIRDMEAVTRQAGDRRVQLGRLIESLDQTLGTTAAAAAPLDAGIASLPATETQLRSLLRSLTRTATDARPLAADLGHAAPRLGTLLDRAPGFLDDVRAALRTSRPTLELTRQLLVAGAPTIAADPQRVVTGSFDLAPALSNLLKGILGGDETIKGLFGDERNGGPESRPGFGFGFGAMSSDPGNIPGYPADWSDRKFLRVDALLNCEVFGVPVRPGCLEALLAARAAGRARRERSAKPSHVTPAAARQAGPTPPTGGGSPPAPEPAHPGQKILDGTGEALHGLGDGTDSTLQSLLDYLLR